MREFVGRARSGRLGGARALPAAFAAIRTRPPTPATRPARRSVGRSYATHEDRGGTRGNSREAAHATRTEREDEGS